jgi:hypothetical protein
LRQARGSQNGEIETVRKKGRIRTGRLVYFGAKIVEFRNREGFLVETRSRGLGKMKVKEGRRTDLFKA